MIGILLKTEIAWYRFFSYSARYFSLFLLLYISIAILIDIFLPNHTFHFSARFVF